MTASETMVWIEILKKCGYGHWEAEGFIRMRLDGPVPEEMPEMEDQEHHTEGSD